MRGHIAITAWLNTRLNRPIGFGHQWLCRRPRCISEGSFKNAKHLVANGTSVLEPRRILLIPECKRFVFGDVVVGGLPRLPAQLLHGPERPSKARADGSVTVRIRSSRGICALKGSSSRTEVRRGRAGPTTRL